MKQNELQDLIQDWYDDTLHDPELNALVVQFEAIYNETGTYDPTILDKIHEYLDSKLQTTIRSQLN